MENRFGPWTRRMAMFLPASRSAVTLSRRSLLGIVAGGIFAFLVPTIRDASAQGESKEEKKAIENKGRIFINANLRYKPEAMTRKKDSARSLPSIRKPVNGKRSPTLVTPAGSPPP